MFGRQSIENKILFIYSEILSKKKKNLWSKSYHSKKRKEVGIKITKAEDKEDMNNLRTKRIQIIEYK